MFNLISYLLIFLCILLVYIDCFCLFFNTQPDFWVLFDMSVIYFIYIGAVTYFRTDEPGSLYQRSCFYCWLLLLFSSPIFYDAKNSSIFISRLSASLKNTAVLYQIFSKL